MSDATFGNVEHRATKIAESRPNILDCLLLQDPRVIFFTKICLQD